MEATGYLHTRLKLYTYTIVLFKYALELISADGMHVGTFYAHVPFNRRCASIHRAVLAKEKSSEHPNKLHNPNRP